MSSERVGLTHHHTYTPTPFCVDHAKHLHLHKLKLAKMWLTIPDISLKFNFHFSAKDLDEGII